MSPPKPVEFDAGIMKFDPASKKVTPDARRGRAKVYINNEGEKHFEWRDLKSNKAEIDQYIFEGDAIFDKVKNSTGRVYFLRFLSYEDKYFFWMQEKDTSKDEEIAKKVNEVINFNSDGIVEEEAKSEPPKPSANEQPKPSSQQVPSNSGGQGGTKSAEELGKMFAQALAGMGGGGYGRKPFPDLTSIITPEFLDYVNQDPDFKKALIPHLPEGQQDEKGLRASLKGAQLLQALDALDEALNSDQGQVVLLSLGLDASTFMKASDGTEAFLLALEKLAKDEEKKN